MIFLRSEVHIEGVAYERAGFAGEHGNTAPAKNRNQQHGLKTEKIMLY